jgi:rhodanese-related sulfurtransferase
MDRGFKLVRPLAGGLDAWAQRGFDLEVHDLVARRDAV